NKIRYYEKENGGTSSALNFGIEKMKGDYFSWLSHDDIYLPTKIEEQLNIMDNKICVAASNVNIVDKNLKLIKSNKINSLYYKSVSIFLALDTETGLNGCSLLIPKKIFDDIGFFNENLKSSQDYDMWYRISKKYKFLLVDKNLVLSRQHLNQDSKTKNNLCTKESDSFNYNILKDFRKEEILGIFENNCDYLIEKYKIFYVSGYVKTSGMILKTIIENSIALNKFEEINKLLKDNLNLMMNNTDYYKNDYRKEKKTILFYSNVWNMGGIEKMLSILLPTLTKSYNIILLSQENKNNESFDNSNFLHLTYESINYNNISDFIVTICLSLKIDVFVGNPNILLDFLDVYPKLKSIDIKTIAYNHYYYFLPYTEKWLYPIINKRDEVYKDVDLVTWLSKFNVTCYNSNTNKNGILLENFTEFPITKRNINKKSKKILSVARFDDSIKQVDKIINTFKILSKNDKNMELFLVGKYDLEMIFDDGKKLKELIENTKNINFIGEVTDVSKYYKMCDIYLMTSKSEGFSLSTLEAITFGLPCVMFKISGLESLVENNVNGYIVDQGNIESLAEAIKNIFNDDSLREKMSCESIKKAKKYQKKEFIKRWEQILNILTNSDSKNLEKILEKEFYVDYSKEIDTFEIINEYNKNIKNIILNPNEMIKYVYESKLVNRLKRLKNSLKQNGFKNTCSIIKDKIKNRIGVNHEKKS
ncbi:MAG: glycosyltransferase, partial [Bacilli bacterium]